MDKKIFISGIQLQDGIDTASGILRWVLFRLGAHVTVERDYLSTIYGGKAGTTVYQCRFSAAPHYCPGDEKADFLLALELGKKKGELPASAKNYVEKLNLGGICVYDSSIAGEVPAPQGNIFLPVPAYKLAKSMFAGESEEKIGKISKAVLLGTLLDILGGDEDCRAMAQALEKQFSGKAKVVESNLAGYREGRQYSKENFSSVPRLKFVLTPHKNFVSLSGNDATALGAISAGEKFYAGYPITPATAILDYKEKNIRKAGGVSVQLEDEIASAGAVLGASFGGALASTATSGPGMDLMTEMIGHSGMTEVPFVLVNVQRAGPSTGMPTKTEQSDLLSAIFSNHGEIPKIVLAAGDAAECYEEIIRAYYFARKYRLPVIVLTSLDIAEGWYTMPSPDLNYGSRFQTKYGAAIPGQKGVIAVAMGTEHDEHGFVSTSRQNRIEVTERRLGKLERYLAEDYSAPKSLGNISAPILLVSWGSSKGPVLEARARLEKQGVVTRAVHFTDVWPLSAYHVGKLVKGPQKIFVVEGNATGQFASLLRQTASEAGALQGPDKLKSILRFDGRPFEPRQIVESVLREAQS